MRRLTDRTSALVRGMLMPPSVYGPLTGYHAQLVAEIGQCGEVAAVPPLMWPLFESKETGEIAAHSIGQILAVASHDELLELEEDIRWKSSWDLPYSWSQLTVQSAQRILPALKSQLTLLGILSWHPSGHVREYACRMLATYDESSVTAFLLPRLNDWVAPVRETARTALQHRIDAGGCSDLLGHLYLVFRLLDCKRTDHRPLVKLVLNELTAPHQRSALIKALKSPIKSVRRTCYRLSIEMDGDHRPVMIRDCLQSHDPVLRLWAARDAREVLPLAELELAVQAMRGDPVMPLRREALLAVMTHFPDRAVVDLTGALLEPSVSMRDFARFYLKRLGSPASAEFYRDVLSNRPVVASAVAGLGETGSRCDAETVQPFLFAPSVKLRAAATRAVGVLAADEYTHWLLVMLQDSSRKVSDEAAKALKANVSRIELPDLWKAFQSRHKHVRRAVLKLIAELNIWSTLPFLIEAATHVDTDTAEHAQRIVQQSKNRVFTRPNTQQREAINARLIQVGHACPEFVKECLQLLNS